MSMQNDSSREAIIRENEALSRRVEELSRELTRSRAAEREASDVVEKRAQWIVRLAHDLRNPISGIREAVDSTLQTMLTADQRHDLEVVRRTADGVLDLVNNLIELPPTGADLPQVEHREFNFDELLGDVIQASTPAARKKALSLTSHCATDIPTKLIGDPRRLRRILANLVGNAIKFTERGEVAVRARFGLDDTLSGHLHFMVEDTGVGIAEEHQTAIFESFRQVHRSQSAEGVGLGLSICLELTRQLDGRIWVESQLGRGSRFHVQVPVTQPIQCTSRDMPCPDPVEPRQDAPSVPPLRILLAEDCEVNQMVVAGLLGSFGHQVEIVTNGRQAIDALQRQSYDAVLMDLEMPGVDGIQATRSLRASTNESHRHVPIIGMTAHVDPRVARRCLNSGMDSCLSKPLHPDQVAQLLDTLTRRRRSTCEADARWDGPHDPRIADRLARESPTSSGLDASPISVRRGLLRVDDQD